MTTPIWAVGYDATRRLAIANQFDARAGLSGPKRRRWRPDKAQVREWNSNWSSAARPTRVPVQKRTTQLQNFMFKGFTVEFMLANRKFLQPPKDNLISLKAVVLQVESKQLTICPFPGRRGIRTGLHKASNRSHVWIEGEREVDHRSQYASMFYSVRRRWCSRVWMRPPAS